MAKNRISLPGTDIDLPLPGKHESVASRARHVLLGSAGGTMLVGAATVAVAAWQELEHRHLEFADLKEVPVRVETLAELKHDPEALALIEAGLKKEWGHFGLLGFDNIHDMAAQAGSSIFIALLQDGDKFLP